MGKASETEGPCETCGRAKGERKPKCQRCPKASPLERMFPEPLPVTILAFDVGAAFGWAILRGVGKHVRILDHGEGSIWTSEPDVVVQRAIVAGAVACVLEEPGLAGGKPGRPMPPRVHYGMGSARGVLMRAWRLQYGTRSRDLEIPCATWRGAIIGGAQRPTGDWKRDAKLHLARTHGTAPGDPHGGRERPWGDEDCDAACLGEYAIHSVELVDTIGPQALGKLGWKESEKR